MAVTGPWNRQTVAQPWTASTAVTAMLLPEVRQDSAAPPAPPFSSSTILGQLSLDSEPFASSDSEPDQNSRQQLRRRGQQQQQQHQKQQQQQQQQLRTRAGGVSNGNSSDIFRLASKTSEEQDAIAATPFTTRPATAITNTTKTTKMTTMMMMRFPSSLSSSSLTSMTKADAAGSANGGRRSRSGPSAHLESEQQQQQQQQPPQQYKFQIARRWRLSRQQQQMLATAEGRGDGLTDSFLEPSVEYFHKGPDTRYDWLSYGRWTSDDYLRLVV